MMGAGGRVRKDTWARYGVTDECDGCGVCATCAPCNFARSDDGTYYYVIQQPEDDGEERGMRRAMAGCPLHCIRDDVDTAE